MLTVAQQGQLANKTAGADQAQHRGVAGFAERPDGQTSLRHEVERFSGVTGMKDDVALGEALASAVAQEAAAFVAGELGEKGPFINGVFPSPSRVGS